jgi:hypothetical protein
MVKNLIESRRSSSITKREPQEREPQERVSIMGVIHYSDIYTFDPDGGRWDGVSGRWVHYEGYGRRDKGKTDFMKSINQHHDLWAPHAEPGTPREIVPYSSLGKRDPKKVRFLSSINKRVVENFCNDMSDEYHYDTIHALDGSDRVDRGSVNFQQMLVDYVEKAVSKKLKEGFFDVGGVGRKWSENMDFVSYFTQKFMEIEGHLNEDRGWKISLSNHGIRDYPLSHYRGACDRFFTYNWGRINAEKDRVSVLRATASAFTPGSQVPGLQRCGPEKICGVYKVDLPARGIPCGTPPPRRPSASSGNSTCHLTWEQKGEQERDFSELSNKLDMIVALQQ